MNKNQIINDLYNGQIIEKIVTDLVKDGWISSKDRKDFIQEIYLIICELNEQKINELYENKQLVFYIISIVRNQAKNKKSNFHKKYDRNKEIPLKEFLDYDIEKEI